MRFLVLFSVCVILSSCVRKQVVTNRLEGEWNLTKYLKQDGSYTYFSDITYTFQGGDADGKTYLGVIVKKDTVQTDGKCLVNKKGSELYIMQDVNHPEKIDTLRIEDIDKNSFVGRSPGYVWFLDRK